MKVTRPGSVLRRRSSSAALPTATRSRDLSRASASSSEMRAPSSALSRISATLIGQPLAYERGGGEGEPGGSPSVSKKGAAWEKHGFPPRERAGGERRSYGDRLVDESQLGHLVQLARIARQLEEGVEAGALAWAEAVAELLEVAGEEARRVPVALAPLEGEV